MKRALFLFLTVVIVESKNSDLQFRYLLMHCIYAVVDACMPIRLNVSNSQYHAPIHQNIYHVMMCFVSTRAH